MCPPGMPLIKGETNNLDFDSSNFGDDFFEEGIKCGGDTMKSQMFVGTEFIVTNPLSEFETIHH